MLGKGSCTMQCLLKHCKRKSQPIDLLHGMKSRQKEKADVKDRMHYITTPSFFYSFVLIKITSLTNSFTEVPEEYESYALVEES